METVSGPSIPRKWEIWPIAIILSFVFFISFILFWVFVMLRNKSELVSNDYYEKELTYQEQIDKTHAAQSANKNVDIAATANEVVLAFPNPSEGAITGLVKFSRPSNSKLDFGVNIETDAEGKLRIRADSIQPGLWNVTIDWQQNHKAYYQESYFNQ